MMVTVRESTSSDEAAVAEVERLATADLRKIYRPTAVARKTRAAVRSTSRRIVAEVDGRVVGTVQYVVAGEQLSLMALGVHPAFRRRGIARTLVQHLETLAVDAGCRTVTLYTVRETGNVTIFERLGFTVVSEHSTSLFESERHPTLSEVAMRKNLAGRSPPRGGGI